MGSACHWSIHTSMATLKDSASTGYPKPVLEVFKYLKIDCAHKVENWLKEEKYWRPALRESDWVFVYFSLCERYQQCLPQQIKCSHLNIPSTSPVESIFHILLTTSSVKASEILSEHCPKEPFHCKCAAEVAAATAAQHAMPRGHQPKGHPAPTRVVRAIPSVIVHSTPKHTLLAKYSAIDPCAKPATDA